MAFPARAAAPFLIGLSLFACAPARAAQFKVQAVDSVGFRGVHSSLALDSRGMPHISYFGDNQILYASKRDSTWTWETVANDVGAYAGLALDANDAPHICYFDSTNADVRYATRAPGFWVDELVDSAGSVGQYISVALDSQGRPAAAYADYSNEDLKYAQRVNGVWSVERADTTGIVGYYTSLAFDPVTGQPCVSYLDLEGGLRFARRTPAGWTVEEVDFGTNVGGFSSLVMDSLGHGHISYGDLGTQTVKYAEQTALGWYLSTVDGTYGGGAYTSLRLDAAGNPRISYIGLDRRLRYAARTGAQWDVTTVDPLVQVTHFTSLKLDPWGNPLISYWDELRANLKIADASLHLLEPHGGEFWSGGSTQNVVWYGTGPVNVYLSQDAGASYTKVTETPDPYPIIPILVPAWNSGSVLVKVVRDSVLAVSQSPTPLTVTTGLSTPWWTRLVDGTGLTGFSPSIALAANESPRISYWDTSNGAVRFASRRGGLWTSETVASGLGSHTGVSLAIDRAGVPSIAYFDNASLQLAWATHERGFWESEFAVPTLAAGEHCSQALDIYGRPRIAFFERVPGRLVLTARNGVAWGTETVETGDSLGLWNSLAIDSLGYPYISYYDAKAGDLKFASKTGAAYAIETVDAVGNVGANTSLALDANLNPHISYVDVTHGSLKHAVKSGGTWTIETVDASGRVGGTTSIALDASGEPRIAYHDRVTRKLLVARRTGGTWVPETVTPVVNAGAMSSLALGADGNARIAYVDDALSDLRYASSAIELREIPPGSVWPVGARRTISWDGNGFVDVSLSHDGGATYDLLASSVSGGSYIVVAPGPASTRCVLRVERVFPASVSLSDTFAIETGVQLLSFRAEQTPFGTGADVTWETDPTVPDLAGYRLERAVGGGGYTTLLGLTTSTSYHDDAAGPGASYRLTAVDGVGTEYGLGVATFQPRKPLAAGPLPYRSGTLAISFAARPHAEVRLYDIRGRLVRTLTRGDFVSAFQSVIWDGKDEQGRRVPSGLYVLKSVTAGHETSIKIAVIR
ncbi:MAG TPA: hypothetical protein VFD83_04735 [Candidatus Polarisedimenticolia bacterium]|nr:hypothetical protein [Candidatus Polarisedimenticolia bacterium]